MLSISMLLLSLSWFSSLNGSPPSTPGLFANSLDANTRESDNPMLKNDRFLDDIISSINIDYAKNALTLHFRKGGSNSIENGKNKVVLDQNFMRFGRGDSALMRFGKRQAESMGSEPEYRRRNSENSRDSRGDNFMRFGRSNDKLMRFGSSSDCDMIPCGRSNGYGGSSNSLMQLGRADSLMRLASRPLYGSVNDNTLNQGTMLLHRFGRNDKNFMRFGKLDQNFMRFGKRYKNADNEEYDTSKSDVSSDHIDTTLKADRI